MLMKIIGVIQSKDVLNVKFIIKILDTSCFITQSDETKKHIFIYKPTWGLLGPSHKVMKRGTKTPTKGRLVALL